MLTYEYNKNVFESVTGASVIFYVLQGPILDRLLIYGTMGPLGKLILSLGVTFHFCADVSQIYVAYLEGADVVVKMVHDVVQLIKNWKTINFLCLNEDNIEV